MYTKQYIDGLKGWLLDTTDFDYILTYRPKKSKITIFNAQNVFSPIFNNTERIKSLYYVIESDYSRVCNHAHILVEGKDLMINDFKTRRIKPLRYEKKLKKWVKNEIPYFEKIVSKRGVLDYVTKHFGKNDMYVRGQDMLHRNRVIDEQIMDLVNGYNVHNNIKSAYPHPNEKYHKRAVNFMNLYSRNKLRKLPYS